MVDTHTQMTVREYAFQLVRGGSGTHGVGGGGEEGRRGVEIFVLLRSIIKDYSSQIFKFLNFFLGGK